ncbi:cytochrome P450 [Lentzea roselyniae]|uniref:Cytochrome P450 n=2 Tax=Lentzea roselyniae TaxID=531940 RepID=A0ABP7C2G2_9PSEU
MPFLQSLADLGPVVRMYLWRQPVYVLTSAQLVHRMLVRDSAKFEKGFVFDKARALLGNGLFTADAQTHLKHRRLVQPAFHRDRVAEYTELIIEQADDAVSSWSPGSLDARLRMGELSTDVVTTALFSTALTAEQKAIVVRALPAVLTGFIQRALYPHPVLEKVPLPTNRRFDAAVHDLRAVVDDIVARCAPEDSNVVSLLLAARDEHTGEGMDAVQVRDEVVSLLLAGAETSATTLTWLLYELARHPELQDEIRQEVASVTGGGSLQVDDVARLTRLGHALTETLRLHTPNWILMRRVIEPVEFDGTRLEPGAEILFSLSALHRDHAVFADPAKFDPDRWREGTVPRTSFMPFITGNRKCIGESFAWNEMVVIAASVVARWQLVLEPGCRVRENATSATVQAGGLKISVAPVAPVSVPRNISSVAPKCPMRTSDVDIQLQPTLVPGEGQGSR